MTASSPFASDCSRGESLQETTLDFRDMAGETFRLRRDMPGEKFPLLFPFFLSLLAGKKSESVTLERGNFSHKSRTWLASSQLYPYSTTESGQDPVQPDFPHLMIRRQATSVHSKQKPDFK